MNTLILAALLNPCFQPNLRPAPFDGRYGYGFPAPAQRHYSRTYYRNLTRPRGWINPISGTHSSEVEPEKPVIIKNPFVDQP